MTFRFTAFLPDDFADNATIPGHAENIEAEQSVKNAIHKKLGNFDVANTTYVEIEYDHYNDKVNATVVFVNGVVQMNSGSAFEAVQFLHKDLDFIEKGEFGEGWLAKELSIRGKNIKLASNC